MRAVVTIFPAAVAAACFAEAPPTGGEVDELPTFSLVEELRLDGHELLLVPIDTVQRLAVAQDGTIAIAQQQEYAVRFYSAAGEFLGSIGRRGEGPAEFLGIYRLGWMGGDTLYAFDQAQQRFTLISPELEYVRYVHVPTSARPSAELAGRIPAFGFVRGAALYADGSVYGRLTSPLGDLGEFDPTKWLIGQVAEDGTILSFRNWLPDTSPFPTGPFLRLANDGSRIATLDVSVEGPDAGTFEVVMEALGGDTLYVRRYAFDARPIPQALVDSINDARRARVASFPPGVSGPEFEPIEVPPLYPPVVALIHGLDGSLWIRLRDTSEGRPYRIHDPDGEPLGTVVVPLNQKIAAASLEHVWILERDEYDVESVLRYRVVPGQRPIA